jgi:hypothetical protein
MLVDRYPEIPQFTGFTRIICEGVGAFYSGYHGAAVASLVPAVEGVLGQMFEKLLGTTELSGAELLKQVVAAESDRAIARLVYHKMWVPKEYRDRRFLEVFDEYVYMLAAFEDFGVNHLFARTASFVGPAQLNRHGILHGKFTDYGVPENFHRLWSILDFLAFMATLGMSGVSVFAPDQTLRAAQLTTALIARGRIPPICR